MDEIMEEYGGTLIAMFGGVLIFAVMAGLMEGNGMLGRIIIWLGNHAC